STRVNGLWDATSLIKNYQHTLGAVCALETVNVGVSRLTSLTYQSVHGAPVLHKGEHPAVILCHAPREVTLDVELTNLLPQQAVNLIVGRSGRDDDGVSASGVNPP